MSNFRKSAGRYGEQDGDEERPPVRPSVVARVAPTPLDDCDSGSDPILTQQFCPTLVPTDDMSSLGDTNTEAGSQSFDYLVNSGDWEAVLMAATTSDLFSGGFVKHGDEEQPSNHNTPRNSASLGLGEAMLPAYIEPDEGDFLEPDFALPAVPPEPKQPVSEDPGKPAAIDGMATSPVRASEATKQTIESGQKGAKGKSTNGRKKVKRRVKKPSDHTRSSAKGSESTPSDTSGTATSTGDKPKLKSKKQTKSRNAGEKGEKTRSRKKKGTPKRNRQKKAVDPQEIIDFVENHNSCTHFEDIHVKPVKQYWSDQERLEESFTSKVILSSHFDDFSYAESQQGPPPSTSKGLSPSTQRPSKKPKSYVRAGGGGSLEIAIAAKPKPRPSTETNSSKSPSRFLQLWKNVNKNRSRES